MSAADRELLKLAAKSISTEIWTDCNGSIYCGRIIDGNEVEMPWNPLTDDGDALRLAVTLRIGNDCYVDGELVEHCCAWVNHRDVPKFHRVYEPYDGDSLAATRRAIVRAAAEIGKMIP